MCTLVNVVMNPQGPQNAGNVVCFLPGRAKDLSASSMRRTTVIFIESLLCDVLSLLEMKMNSLHDLNT